MIYLGLANISSFTGNYERLEFSEYRLEKQKSIRNAKAMLQSVAAEQLLNKMSLELGIAVTLPLKISAGAHGKPYTGDFCFSLSHSDDMVLCAISDKDIGADIQRIKPFDIRLAKRCLREDELSALEAAEDKDAEFTCLWTMKESAVKLSGEGIQMGLSSFSVLKSELFFNSGRIGEYCWCACSHSSDAMSIKNYILE